MPTSCAAPNNAQFRPQTRALDLRQRGFHGLLQGLKQPRHQRLRSVGIWPYLEEKLLVGGWPTPLKTMSSSIGMIIPNTWKNNKCSKPPTSISKSWGITSLWIRRLIALVGFGHQRLWCVHRGVETALFDTAHIGRGRGQVWSGVVSKRGLHFWMYMYIYIYIYIYSLVGGLKPSEKY